MPAKFSLQIALKIHIHQKIRIYCVNICNELLLYPNDDPYLKRNTHTVIKVILNVSALALSVNYLIVKEQNVPQRKKETPVVLFFF